MNRTIHMPSLSHLVSKGILSMGMARKMAGSGIGFSHILLTYRRHGVDGVICLLSERNEGRPRVTSNKKNLNRITDWLDVRSNENISKEN
jgi:hypothetical protein